MYLLLSLSIAFWLGQGGCRGVYQGSAHSGFWRSSKCAPTLRRLKADTNSGAANEKANERKRSALLIKLREEKIKNFVKNPSEIRCDIKLEDSGEEMS